MSVSTSDTTIDSNETTDVTNAGTGAVVEVSSTTTKTPEELAADVDKWKAMSRKHEKDAIANADKAKRLDALEESQKTELQKLADRAEAAEARSNELEARTIRAEVAAAKGVPANLLTGSTKEEMEAAADALVAFKGKQVIPDTGGGARGSDVGGAAQLTQADLDKLAREGKHEEIEAARAAGRFNDLLGIKP